MALPSLGLRSTAEGNTIGGAVSNVAAPSFASGAGSGAGSVASSLVTGAARAGTSVVDGLVGGAENRTLIQQGAGSVVSGVQKLFSGETLAAAGGGVVDGVVRAGTSVVDGFVGGSENRKLIQEAAGSVFGGAKDLITGKQSISGLFSGESGVVGGSVGALKDVSGIVLGPVGGGLINSLGGLGDSLGGREGSDWGHLSKHLLARIFPCDSRGVARAGELGVTGPATEVNFDATLNWQSPFEGIGPEAKAPALMAMLQSGSLVPVVNAIQAVLPAGDGVISSGLQRGSDTLKKAVRDLEGKTGITKLNSRQVFSGMPPIKVTLTLHFRALSDPMAEVVDPYQRLLQWAMPQRLSEDGILAGAVDGAASVEFGKFTSPSTAGEGASSAVDKFLKVMFPSDAPMLVGFIYGNNRYPAMVIESISNALDGPMDTNGRPSYRAVQLTLATLTALDRADIGKMFV